MSDTQTPSPTLLEELAEEYAQLHAQVTPQVNRMEDIKKHFRALTVGYTHDIGPLAITVSRNTRLNAKALEKSFPADEHPGLYDQKLSTTKAREELGEDLIEDFTTVGDPKVSVKVA